MYRLALLSLLLLPACGEDTKPFLEQTDTRAPISTQYVVGPELPVREKPDENAAVIRRILASRHAAA